jgi:hypothetical protein
LTAKNSQNHVKNNELLTIRHDSRGQNGVFPEIKPATDEKTHIYVMIALLQAAPSKSQSRAKNNNENQIHVRAAIYRNRARRALGDDARLAATRSQISVCYKTC